jgi:hypothetical protein
MAKAIAARNQGDDYQALYFWLRACDLFDPRKGVERVFLEKEGVKAFDDVVVSFKSGTNFDEKGEALTADYFQVKFHVTANGAITAEGLTDPAFINATSMSLLQRLHNAQKAHAPDGKGVRFKLYTPWSVDPGDALAEIYSHVDGSIRLDRLFSGGKNSKMGKVRKLWRDHLGLAADDELKPILLPLRLIRGPEFTELQDQLAGAVQVAGLAPMARGARLKHYEDLGRKLIAEGRTEFDRGKIEQICRRENLWNGGPVQVENASRVAIRSFERFTDGMEAQQDIFLDLLPFFEKRCLRPGHTWEGDIFPKVNDFVRSRVEGRKCCILSLPVHSTIAFLAGTLLDPKSGIEILLRQRGPRGEHTWSFDDEAAVTEFDENWTIEESVIGKGTGLAISINLAINTSTGVSDFLRRTEAPVGRLLKLTPICGSRLSSVRDGAHARRLAELAANMIRDNRTETERPAPARLFMAGPNAFSFCLGRHWRGLGSVILHEHDFESGDPSAYLPSLTLPV